MLQSTHIHTPSKSSGQSSQSVTRARTTHSNPTHLTRTRSIAYVHTNTHTPHNNSQHFGILTTKKHHSCIRPQDTIAQASHNSRHTKSQSPHHNRSNLTNRPLPHSTPSQVQQKAIMLGIQHICKQSKHTLTRFSRDKIAPYTSQSAQQPSTPTFSYSHNHSPSFPQQYLMQSFQARKAFPTAQLSPQPHATLTACDELPHRFHTQK